MFEGAIATTIASMAVREALTNARPGGLIKVPAGSLQWLPRSKASECEGCGAPLKAYIHHCEYCRRPS